MDNPILDPEAMAAAQLQQGYQMPEELAPMFQNAVENPPSQDDFLNFLSQMTRMGGPYEEMFQQLQQAGMGSYGADNAAVLQQAIPEMLSQAQVQQQQQGGSGYDDMQSQMRVLLSALQGY